jgi:hypothetical protein
MSERPTLTADRSPERFWACEKKETQMEMNFDLPQTVTEALVAIANAEFVPADETDMALYLFKGNEALIAQDGTDSYGRVIFLNTETGEATFIAIGPVENSWSKRVMFSAIETAIEHS